MLRIHHFSFAFVMCALLSVLALSSGPAKAAMLDAGAEHTCAIGAGGTVKCWGRNNYGQLGNGTMLDVLVPTNVVGLTGATTVVAGIDHSCAIVARGEVVCWGRNHNGELGDGTREDSLVPVRVASISGVTDIAVGGGYTCAIVQGGAVHCWGSWWIRGDGVIESSYVPLAVPGIVGAVDIVGGNDYACVVINSGKVECWGGIDVDDGDYSGPPEEIPDIAGATTISGTDRETCAIVGQGEVRCWYFPASHFFGPTTVSGIAGAAKLTPGCAILVNGIVECWKEFNVVDSFKGELEEIQPNEVPEVRGATEISASPWHVCARLQSGAIDCWGYAPLLGIAADFRRDMPVVVAGIANAVDVAVGGTSLRPANAPLDACAAQAGGMVTCWGLDRRGNSVAPSLRRITGLAGATAISAGWFGLCAIAVDGVECRGPVDIDARFERVPALDDVQILGVGDSHACVIIGDGSVRCWGDDSEGQLGNGYDDNAFRSVPVEVMGIDNAIDLALGPQHSCAITDAHKLKCWGSMELGIVSGTYEPREIPGISNVVAVATSAYKICVVAAVGTVHCDNSFPSFLAVDNIEHAVDVAVGLVEACALIDDGSVECWSMDGSYFEGDGEHLPYQVMGIRGATAISAKQTTMCAVVEAGVRCWGAKDYGILGDGSSPGFATPQPVVGAPFSRTTDVQVFAESGALSNASISPFSVQVGRTAAGSAGRVHLTASPSPALVDPVWNCVATGDAECPFPDGMAGDLDVEFLLPPAGDLQFRLLATIDASRGATAKLSARLSDASGTGAFEAIERQRELPIVGGIASAHRGPPRPCSAAGTAVGDCEAARVGRSVLQHRDR